MKSVRVVQEEVASVDCCAIFFIGCRKEVRGDWFLFSAQAILGELTSWLYGFLEGRNMVDRLNGAGSMPFCRMFI
jgi:hypothetical protein